MIAPLVSLLIAAAQPARMEEVPRCSARVAEPATVEQITADPAAWKGRCVAVTAMTNGYSLYSGVEGFYRSRRAGGSDPTEDPDARGRLGLDNHRLMRRLPRDRFSMVTAIGRIQDCEEMRAAVQASLGPDEIGWVSGYCHTASGPVIWLVGLRRAGPLVALRHMGEAARDAYGDLAFAPEGWPHRGHVEARVAAFLAALQGGDRRSFAAMHDRGVNPEDAETAVRLAFVRGSPFAEIARATAPPEIAIFVERDGLEPRSEQQDEDVAATICFCRTASCAGKWPIARIDADNRPERPYACTVLTPFILLRRTEQIFMTEQKGWGLTEPQDTALRRRSDSARR